MVGVNVDWQYGVVMNELGKMEWLSIDWEVSGCSAVDD